MEVSARAFGWKHFYLLAGGVGLVWGVVIGIGQRNCSHPSQPPFLQCVAEDPTEVIIPMVAVTVYALAFGGLLHLVYRAFRHVERLTLVMMLAGGVLAGWWALSVEMVCTTEAPDHVSCWEFADWPGVLVPILAGVLVFGLFGRLVVRIRQA